MPLLGSSLLLLAPALAQQTGSILIAQGDVLPNGDVIDDVLELAINDAGQWAAVVRLVQPGIAQALVQDGQVLYRTGDPLPGLASGLFFDRAFGLELSPTGELTWIETTSAFGWINGRGRAVFAGSTPLFVAGQTPIGPELALASPIEAIINAAQDGLGGLFVGCRLTPAPDPAFDGWALLHLPSTVPNTPAALVAASGDPLAGTGTTITTVADSRDLLDAAGGKSLYHVDNSQAQQAIVLDQQVVAVTGESSPLFGFPWVGFEDAVAVNSAGNVAFTGRVGSATASRSALVVDGALVAITEGPAPADPAFDIESLGQQFFNAPIALDESGRIFWYADWNDPNDDRDEALHRDLEVIIQEGVSRIDGLAVVDLSDPGFEVFFAEFAISPDGTKVAVRVELEDGRVVGALVQPDAAEEPFPGCGTNLATLSISLPKAGSALLAQLSGAQASSALGFVALSTAPAVPGSPCGIDLGPAGEILVDVGPSALIALEQGILPAFVPTVAVPLGTIPDSIALYGLELFAQGAFVAPAAAQPVRLSNAIALRIGL